MIDGDGVLFNRQPTLHEYDVSHAKIMKQGDTFRMNVADTKPYNADFDGDEMNLHMPQDIQSEAELKSTLFLTKSFRLPTINLLLVYFKIHYLEFIVLLEKISSSVKGCMNY